jgi:hypothetical protein
MSHRTLINIKGTVLCVLLVWCSELVTDDAQNEQHKILKISWNISDWTLI